MRARAQTTELVRTINSVMSAETSVGDTVTSEVTMEVKENPGEEKGMFRFYQVFTYN